MNKKILIVAGAAIAVIGVVVCCILIQPNTPADPTGTTTAAPHIHDYKNTETVDATCQKEGYAVYACECGESYQSKIKKTDHQYELTDVNTKEDGTVQETYTCKICDKTYVNETPGTGKDNPGTTPDKKPDNDTEHEHDYQISDSHDPTCKDTGYVVYTCAGCSESYRVDLDVVDHKYELTKVVEATPEQDGYEEYTCIYCGKSFQVPLTYTE